MAKEPPLSPFDNSPFPHRDSSETPLSLSPPLFSQLKPSTLQLGPTEIQQPTQTSPKKANFHQMGCSNSDEMLTLGGKESIFQCDLEKLDVGFVQNEVIDEFCQGGTSNSSEKLNLEGEDTNSQCELEKVDVGFVQNEVIDENPQVGSSNSSEKLNLEGKDTIIQYELENFDVEFENNGENFDGVFQNSSKTEDLKCSLMINDTDVVDVLKVEGKRNRKRGKKGGNNLNNSGFLGVCVGGSNVGKRKCVYSRKEMEKLRYVNVKAQKKFWQEIYDGFSTISRKEYDELGSFRHNKKHKGSISGHNQTGAKKNSNDGGILGESCLNCAEEIVCSLKSDCDVDNGYNVDENVGDLVEEWSEDEESDDEYENIQRPAFKVDGEPDFESGPPEDGLEYLRRVRWEAKQIPKVKVVKLNNIKVKDQSLYMPKIPDIEECPPHLMPLRSWEDEFIADFSNLRLALSRLEDSSCAGSVESDSVIFSRQEPKSYPSKSLASLELTSSGKPLTSTVLAMDPVTRVAMLRKRISLFETSSDSSKDECGWLFALCAVVETPLDADTCASLRCLLRRCAKLRAEKTEVDDEVAMLNVLATISGRFFGQSEN